MTGIAHVASSGPSTAELNVEPIGGFHYSINNCSENVSRSRRTWQARLQDSKGLYIHMQTRLRKMSKGWYSIRDNLVIRANFCVLSGTS